MSGAKGNGAEAAAVVAHALQAVPPIAEEIVRSRQRVVTGGAARHAGERQLPQQVAAEIEQEVAGPVGRAEENAVVLVLRQERSRELGSYFIGVAPDARADDGARPLAACAQPLHRRDRA